MPIQRILDPISSVFEILLVSKFCYQFCCEIIKSTFLCFKRPKLNQKEVVVDPFEKLVCYVGPQQYKIIYYITISFPYCAKNAIIIVKIRLPI